jgi:flagellar hook-associated protein 2
MSAVRLPGMGSGLMSVVDQIMAAEREPLKQMDAKKQKIDIKMGLVNDLEGRLGKVKTELKSIVGGKKFQDYALNVSDPDVIAGTVESEKVIPGQWKIEVLRMAENSGALSNVVADKNQTKMGVGYLKFNTPNGEKKIFINDSNNTLDGIARTINTSELGITATVVQDGSEGEDGYRLIMSSEHYGNNHDVYFPTIYLLDGESDLYFDQERDSKNGLIKVNGFEVEVVNNKLEEIIPGVSLDLKTAKPGKEVNLSVTENYEVIETKLRSFVDSMNGVLSFIQTQNTMDEKTDRSKTLGGDSALRSVESRIKQLIIDPTYGVPGSINRLNQLGVEFNRNGTLDFKEDKFKKLIKTNSKDILAFLRGDGTLQSGFIGKAKTTIDSALAGNTGVISNKKKGLQNQISQIDRNIDSKEKSLANKEDQLRRKFSRLEEQMAKIQAQGAQVGSIAGGGSGLG